MDKNVPGRKKKKKDKIRNTFIIDVVGKKEKLKK